MESYSRIMNGFYPLCLAVALGLSLIGNAGAKSPEEFLTPGSKSAGAPDSSHHGAAANPASSSGKVTAARPASLKPSAAKTAMDTAKLHATYLDGDFDKAIITMEKALKAKQGLTHADSVFIFKHLGVMYAATPSTREKGRHYMAQLIYIEPTAKILDMYASDMIYLIFRNVQEEFESKHPLIASRPEPAADTAPQPPPAAPIPAPAPAARSASKSKTLYWVTGGTVLAVGAAGLLFVLLDDPKPKQHNIVIPE